MKRISKNADETDAYSKWRKVFASFSRPGAVKKIKKSTHRRERREAKNWINEQLDDENWNPLENPVPRPDEDMK